MFLILVKERLFPSFVVPALKIGFFSFIWGTIVPIDGCVWNEMFLFIGTRNSLFLNISFCFVQNGSYLENGSSFVHVVQQNILLFLQSMFIDFFIGKTFRVVF